uniref:ATP-binding cassette transporter sub-family C member 5 n=1 Tax=Tigriopus japonicus TaxID=158387 RepID=A0A0A7ARD8_TIGJA|nr:ATP-binding cassette transporter sub-family C member 5 [Tigriopus japonicus]
MGDRPIIRPESNIQVLPITKNKKSPANGQPIENINGDIYENGLGGFVPSCPETRWNKKYNTALKTLIPYRPQPKEGRYLPMEKVGCWSYLTLSWYTGTMWKAFRTGLSRLDLLEVAERDQAHVTAQRLQRIWEQEVERAHKQSDPKKRTPSMTKAVMKFCATRVCIAGIMLMISIVLQFLGPSLVLKLLLDYINQPLEDLNHGWILVLILLLTQFFRTVTFSLNFNIGVHTAQKVVGALQYLGYSKLLRLASPNEAALGQLMTFFTGDEERIIEGVIVATLFLGTPILFILSGVYSTYLVGPVSLVGFLIILLFYPVMGGIAAAMSKMRLKIVHVTDKRTTQMNEILNSIRLIKIYGWEKSFEERIHKIRRQEIKELRKAAFLQSAFTSITPSVTIIATIVTFFALTASGYRLTTPEAFTVFSVFVSLQFTVGTLPYALKCLAEANVSFQRLQKFMELPEYANPSSIHFDGEEAKNLRLRMKNATLAWTKPPEWISPEDEKKKDKKNKMSTHANGLGTAKETEPLKDQDDDQQPYTSCLFDIDLEVEEGTLLGIAGPIGSGKSSLLSAIMGEMKQLTGDVKIRGSLALVSQQAWIFNGTLRDNILMGSTYEKDRYKSILRACTLETDLELLPNGDQTEIGERGVNLSGGQKQRVNLARALYADLDIYLLDDPLSAVDARVAKRIFHGCVLRELKAKGKTVLLVTHGMQFLEKCDKVVYMSNGTILEHGTHSELMKRDDGHYLHMSTFDQSQKEGRNRGASECLLDDAKPVNESGSDKKRNGSIVSETLDETDAAKGQFVSDEVDVLYSGWGVLLKYFQACGGLVIMFLLFLAILAFSLARLFTSIWLQIWLDHGDGLQEERMQNATLFNETFSDIELKGYVTDNPRLWFYQTVYFLNLGVMVFIGLVKGILLAFQFLKGSARLHDAMLHRVMRSPMSFFDATPSGRILNRFSKDLDELDVRMPFYTEFVCQAVLFCVTQISVVCFVYPYFVPPFTLIILVFVLLDVIMNRGILETKKLENITKSPVIHHLSSAMAGISIIRGYQKQSVFQKKFERDLNIHLSASALFRFANRWFAFRMDLIGMVTIVLTGIFTVLFKGSVTPAIAGLALANVFQTCTFIPFVMRMKADFRARFNSVERVAEYANDLPQEAPEHIPEKKPAESWPEKGGIIFKDVSLRYRPDLPWVLSKISIEINGGEKIGIVGRTGAGKTSLITTLLRLTEIENGSITMDGVNISEIGLHDLRSTIAVIPQDPVLFQGTLRYNVDPFNQYSDKEIWIALEKSHLKEKISGAQNQLSMTVDSEGDNFSVGEKQLICLARALLRKNKVLLLDEATASVDVKTDYLIQATIKEAFVDCTVLTVAHRLHTVVNYDRIMVMQAGEVVEFGPSRELLSNPDGVFSSMIKSVQMTSPSHPTLSETPIAE